MRSKVLTALPAFVATFGGVALYLAVKDKQYWQVVVSLTALIVGGWVGLVSGRKSMPSRPVRGTLLMSLWIVTLIAAGAILTAGFFWVGLRLPEWITTGTVDDETKEIAKLLLGAATAFAAVVFTDDLDKAEGDLWPSTKTKDAYADCFGNRWQDPSSGWSAVHEDHVEQKYVVDGGKAIDGWGIKARHRRAKILQRLISGDGGTGRGEARAS
jgi:hypothetical protein